MFLPFTFPSTTRHLMRISGPDALPFLQGVLSCGVAATQTQRRGPQRPSVPAANTTAAVVHPMGVFTPRGRLLCEGFLVQGGTEGLLLDVHQQVAPLLHTYLCRMRLRKQVRLEDVSQQFSVSVFPSLPSKSLLGEEEGDGFLAMGADLRHPWLGFRCYHPTGAARAAVLCSQGEEQYHVMRICLGIPEGPMELPPNGPIPIECNLDLHHAIDFHKGCYVGQELMARTKHRGVVRKRVLPVVFHDPEVQSASSLLQTALHSQETGSAANWWYPKRGGDTGSEDAPSHTTLAAPASSTSSSIQLFTTTPSGEAPPTRHRRPVADLLCVRNGQWGLALVRLSQAFPSLHNPQLDTVVFDGHQGPAYSVPLQVGLSLGAEEVNPILPSAKCATVILPEHFRLEVDD